MAKKKMDLTGIFVNRSRRSYPKLSDYKEYAYYQREHLVTQMHAIIKENEKLFQGKLFTSTAQFGEVVGFKIGDRIPKRHARWLAVDKAVREHEPPDSALQQLEYDTAVNMEGKAKTSRGRRIAKTIKVKDKHSTWVSNLVLRSPHRKKLDRKKDFDPIEDAIWVAQNLRCADILNLEYEDSGAPSVYAWTMLKDASRDEKSMHAFLSANRTIFNSIYLDVTKHRKRQAEAARKYEAGYRKQERGLDAAEDRAAEILKDYGGEDEEEYEMSAEGAEAEQAKEGEYSFVPGESEEEWKGE